jgi:hypothetical protein
VLTAFGKTSLDWLVLEGRFYQYRGANSNFLHVPDSDFASDVE